MNRLKGLLCLIILVLVTGCGRSESSVTVSSESSDVDEETPVFISNEDMKNIPFLLVNVDTFMEQIMVKDMSNGRAYLFNYSLNTVFMDKFEQYVSVTDFTPGKVAEILDMDVNGNITQIKFSDRVWEFSGIENYTIDADRGVFTIGVTNYRIGQNTAFFSGNIEIGVGEIGANDELRVVGVDKDIWAISVTTGHGVLSIINTDVFDGSLICIGNIYTLINGDMSLEMPEGTYTITVANNGYGGTLEVMVTRNNVQTVDLGIIEKEPLKTCELMFKTVVEEARLFLDGDEIQANQVLIVPYGRHTVSIEAEGYESWTKYLYVNSQTATIVLEMDKSGSSSSGSNTGNNNTNGSGDKDKNEESDSTDKGNTTEEKNQVELEYLTTIRDMISALSGIGN